MAKAEDYFVTLLQARAQTGAQTQRLIDPLIIEHLEAVKATVDYTAEAEDDDLKASAALVDDVEGVVSA